MKKCPTCNKTYEDNMRFCQSDGTPLVEVKEDAPPPDPYKTMVAGKDEIASALPPQDTSKGDPTPEEDVLDIPQEDDPLKTSVVSESEMRDLTSDDEPFKTPASSPFSSDPKPPSESTPPKESISSPPPEPPKFNEPNINPPDFDERFFSESDSSEVKPGSQPVSQPKSEPPTFGKQSMPSDPQAKEPAGERPSGTPIPSPFEENPPPGKSSAAPPFKEPEPPKSSPPSPFGAPSSPFSQPSMEDSAPKSPPVRQSEWQPSETPATSFGEQGIAGGPPSNAPAGAGQNQTLAIVSLALGVLSLFCCTFILPGLAAVVTGFMARSKVNENPNQYGGSGIALAGMITGGVSVLFGIILIILYVFTGALAGLGGF